jgi:hypothetical protein
MSIPPPSAKPVAPPPAPPQKTLAPGTAWLLENGLFQAMNGTIWVSMIAALAAIGASFSAALMAAAGMCVALPVLGWFIGLPIVFFCAMTGAMLWFSALAAIVCAWACTAVTVAAVSFGRRLLNSRG